MNYLHSRNIVHQDIKPQNILFDSTMRVVKLADLGVSNILDQTKNTLSANCGTIRYMSPEQLDGILTNKVDIWALGCVILELVTGQLPYPDVQNEFQISRFIADKRISPKKYSCMFQYFEVHKKQQIIAGQGLHRIFYLNTYQRNLLYKLCINMKNHVFVVMESCLTLDYKNRPSAAELLQSEYFHNK